VDPESLGSVNEFRPPLMFFAEYRAHLSAVT
jgi:hypothetical protein